jgi:hypothetical protein
VQTNVAIKTLHAVNITEHSFSANVEVTLHWMVASRIARQNEMFFAEFKPRVAFANIVDRGEATRSIFDESEIQTEIITNGIEDTFEYTNFTHFWVTATKSVELQQAFSLKDYPFDVQVLKVELRSMPSEVWGRKFDTELCHPSPSLPGQSINHIDGSADFIDDYAIERMMCFRIRDPGSGVAHVYEANIVVQRLATAAFMNTIFPSLLVMLLSLVSFWVEPCDIEGRSSVTLTLLLTQTASMQYIQGKLPPVPVLTSVESIIVASTLVLTFQGLMQIQVSAECDRVHTDAEKGFITDDGIHDTDPLDHNYYPNSAKRLDQVGIVVTMLTIVVFIVLVANLWLRKFSRINEFTDLHRQTFASVTEKDFKDREDKYRNVSSSFLATERDRNAESKLAQEEKAALEIELTKLRVKLYSMCKREQESSIDTYLYEWRTDFWQPWQHTLATSTKLSGKKKLAMTAPPRAALIFDCGTGETKPIVCVLVNGLVHVIEPDAKLTGGKKKCLEEYARAYKNHTSPDFSRSAKQEVAVQHAGDKLVNDHKKKEIRNIYRELGLDAYPGATALRNERDRLFILQVGTEVEAVKAKVKKWAAGKIDKINSDGTYTVQFNDGTSESVKPPEYVRVKEPSSLRPTYGSSYFIKVLKEEGLAFTTTTQDLHQLLAVLSSDVARGALYRKYEDTIPILVWEKIFALAQGDASKKPIESNEFFEWMTDVEKKFRQGELVDDDTKVDKDGNKYPVNLRGVFTDPEHEVTLRVTIGVSAWYRKSYGSESHKQCRQFLDDIKKERPEYDIERLTELDECWYEARSVQYAWRRTHQPVRKSLNGEIEVHHDDTKDVGALLGIGGGSTQFSSTFKRIPSDDAVLPWKGQPKDDFFGCQKKRREKIEPEDKPRSSSLTPFVIEHGNRKGTTLLIDAMKKDWKGDPSYDQDMKRNEGDAAWVRSQHDWEKRAHWLLAYRSWEKMCDDVIVQWIKEQGLEEHQKHEFTGPVILISGGCYAGIAAGIAKDEDLTAAKVIDVFKKFVDDLRDSFPADTEKFQQDDPKKAEGHAKNVANLTYVRIVLEHLFKPKTHIRFKRDWKLPVGNSNAASVGGGTGKVAFRTTWSSGYFLDQSRMDGEDISL